MAAAGGWEMVVTVDAQNPVVGDIAVRGTRFGLTTSLGQAVAQSVDVVLSWWRGEWFLDTKKGLPMLEGILKKGVTAASVQAILRQEILAIDGVRRIAKLTVSIDSVTRVGTVPDLDVVNTDGETQNLGGQTIGSGGEVA